MADHWAISGVDLHLGPLGSRVRAGLEDAIRDGRLAPGTRLPSSRALEALSPLRGAQGASASITSPIFSGGQIGVSTGVVMPPATNSRNRSRISSIAPNR